MTTYLISGSRKFKRLDLVEKALRKLPKDSKIIFGDARGVDAAAKEAATKLGLSWREFKADWRGGAWAGPARNSEMIEEADRVVAFWDQKSTGTADAIAKTRKARKPLLVVYDDGTPARREEPEPEPEQTSLWG